jgi:hypothetical protein
MDSPTEDINSIRIVADKGNGVQPACPGKWKRCKKKKKNMNSNASVMYIHVPCIVYRCCDVYLYISEKPPR